MEVLAYVAAAISFSFWEALGQFLFSITAASLIGVVSGWLVLRLRAKATDAPVSTVLSFVTPFLASVPAEHIGASGLVAAVAAGLVTGHGSIRWLTAEQRLTQERMNVQYRELRRARSQGIYDSEVLREALSRLDAEQLYRHTLND